MKKLKHLGEEFRVLYVEDEDNVRVQTHMLLEKFFKEVTSASNGLEGLNYFKESKFDLIITDIMMPKMNGFKMIEEIRKIDYSQKILITSAYQEIDYFLEAIKYTVDGYILKPIETKQFLLAIQKVCMNLRDNIDNKNYKLKLEEMVKDKTFELQEKSEELQKELIKDSLTTLYSKRKLSEDLKKNELYVMALINIDNFSKINLTYGYSIGDKLLKYIALFLRDKLISNSTIYRFNSDEFIYLFSNSNLDKVEKFIDTLRVEFFKREFKIENLTFKLSFTASIVQTDGKKLISKAEVGLEKARLIGKNRIIVFSGDEELERELKTNLYWMRKVNSSLEYDLITPFYQPIVNNKTLKIEKYEVLARIVEDDKIIEPYFFLTPAKVVGLIPDITKVIIEKSFKYFDNRDISFSINITEIDLKENYLLEIFKEFFKIYNIKPSNVILEILEDISVFSSPETIKQINKLKEMGILISLDDFGAEKANFSRILDLNVNFIKIDELFIKNIALNKKSLIITKAIVYMAKEFNIQTIAEYVHNRETFEVVRDLGVDFSQGYYFSKPKPNI